VEVRVLQTELNERSDSVPDGEDSCDDRSGPPNEGSVSDVKSLLECFVVCSDALQDRLKQLKYLVDLHEKIHQVTQVLRCGTGRGCG